jgi:hypothetical protein
LTDSIATERLLFPESFSKPAVLEFGQRQGSSDGGAVLLKAVELPYGLLAGMSDCLCDSRQAGKVDHSLRDLFASAFSPSRVAMPEKGFYIACRDLKPDRRFLVNAESGQYPIDAEIRAIGLHELAAMLAALAD